MNAYISFLTVVLLQSLFHPLDAHHLTAETNISEVLQKQNEIVFKLSSVSSESLPPFARSYINYFQALWKPDDDETHRTLKHPLKVFRLLKHLTYDWDILLNELRITGCVSPVSLETIKLIRHNATFPVFEDLMSMGDAIGRLQRMYQLNTSDVANGVVRDAVEPVVRLSAEECFLIGSALFRTEKYVLAVEWMEEAQKRLLEESFFNNISGHPEILITAQAVIKIAKSHTPVEKSVKPGFQLTIPHYEQLCRNDLVKGVTYNESLHCYYETYNKPLLILQPLKMEVLHDSPKIILIHDFMLKDQAGQLVELSRNNLKPPKSTYSTSNTTTIFKRRLSKSASLPRNISSLVDKVEYWSAVASNLDSKYSEVLQVKNYGVGGALQLHFDLLQQDTRDFSVPDRMATVLIYLDNVEAGGATIFPLLNLTIPAAKNAAVLWFNQYDDGDSNGRTLHAGCPVLLGEKWVAIKWFHDIGQSRQCPCGMPEERQGRKKLIISQVKKMITT